MRKRWIVKSADERVKALLASELGISPVIAQLLANRSIIEPLEAHRFLNGTLKDLYDPYLLKDMDKAVARVRRAISRGERILIFGDYDVDGITSVALLSSILKGLGGNTYEHIPNRLHDGYGLNLDTCRHAHKKKINLVITVDCGINAVREVEYLNSMGIDTIVVDHHKVQKDSIPKACAIIDPLQHDCTYPFKHLAGVGLAFKLSQAILDLGPDKMKHLMDLVALGTVSDIAPQTGENRILTRHGLDTLTSAERIGLKELIRVSGLMSKEILSSHIGFILGPRINASGRIGSPKLALKLLLTDDPKEARDLATMLDKENRSRQRIEASILKEAVEKVKVGVNFKEDKVIVVDGQEWHPGVIGIVASRLVDKFYRPTVVVSTKQRVGRGSARSVKGFNLFEALSKCKHLFGDFGGHEAACGFDIDRGNLQDFKDEFNRIAKESLQPEELLPRLEADMDMPLNSLSEELISDIEKLAPHGPKNPSPVFISRDIKLKNLPKAIGRNGIKFWVTDEKITCEAVAFGVSPESLKVLKEGKVDLAYLPSVNTYKGVRSIKLKLADLRISERPL